MNEYMKRWYWNNVSNIQGFWENAPFGNWVVYLATEPGVLSDDLLKLFAFFCVRQTPLGSKQRYIADVIETYYYEGVSYGDFSRIAGTLSGSSHGTHLVSLLAALIDGTADVRKTVREIAEKSVTMIGDSIIGSREVQGNWLRRHGSPDFTYFTCNMDIT